MLSKLKILKKHYLYIFLFCVFLIGVFLRLYNIESFVTFLGDQGRDAIILKRILTLEHLTAIGAPSSIGGVYLGPFYYYFISPWLLLFNFNPVGPAIGVALFSCLYIIINYYIVKKIINQKTALISSLLIAFSSTFINFSRFSWNPNLLPLFSLITVYFFIKAFEENKNIYYFILAGAFLSFTIQLHYLALLLVPPLLCFFGLKIFKDKKSKINLKYLMSSVITFVFFSSPLIVFDLRHQFLNTKNFINLFNHSSSFSQDKIANFLTTFKDLNQYSFNIQLPLLVTTIFLLFWLTILFFSKRKKYITLFLIIVLFNILGISFYSDLKSSHYFASIYAFYYIVIAYYLSLFKGKKILITIFLLIIFIFYNSKGYYFLYTKGYSQIKKAEKVAQVIMENNFKEKYSLISLPERSSDSPYRYFLELWKKKPVERDIPQKTDELFITCDQPCLTIGNPQWDVAYFAPKKVDNTWEVEDVTIYKLSH